MTLFFDVNSESIQIFLTQTYTVVKRLCTARTQGGLMRFHSEFTDPDAAVRHSGAMLL
jgi:hypothetical protein